MLSHLFPPKMFLKVILKQKDFCYQISGKTIEQHFQLFLLRSLLRGKMTAVDISHRATSAFMKLQCNTHSHHRVGPVNWAMVGSSSKACDGQVSLGLSLWSNGSNYQITLKEKSSVDVNWGHLWKLPLSCLDISTVKNWDLSKQTC